MKAIKYYILVLIAGMLTVSCDDYLTVLPENNQSSYQYWETKEEVEAVLAAGYVELRSSMERIFLWGEARGNGLTYEREGSDLQKAGRKLRDMDIRLDNALNKWESVYKSIAMANSVIKYAPMVQEKDPSFHEAVMNSLLGEAYFIRSLCYFYLVRTFRDVPYVTEPYVDDLTPFPIAKTDGDEILRACIADLSKESILSAAKEFFPEVDNENQINTKGRATRWAIYALLADIHLWLGDYQECIDYCELVKNSGRVGLITGDNWFLNFYPGNSNESIYEIQYSNIHSQTNGFLTWYGSANLYYTISPYTMYLFSMYDTDIRGYSYSFSFMGFNYKHTATAVGQEIEFRLTTQNDQNYLIYRLADLILMQAEANIMLGNYEVGAELINTIRLRAKSTITVPTYLDKVAMMELLLQERQREFIAEGKCWFDILRIGRRSEMGNDDTGTKDRFKELMIAQVLEGANLSKMSLIRSTLLNSGSWYLPIHKDELNVNPLLVQNEYYENLGN